MRRHVFWIFESFIWLLVLVTISGVFMFLEYQHKKEVNSYQIFLPDVDGLIKGSPVRMLGINIGYVNQIHIIDDEVYVKFIVTQPHTKIPQGSVATVEFTGLGGSKSLEIYKPDGKMKEGTKLIISQPPKRISDSIGLLNQMFEQIADVTYSISNFMTKLGVIKTVQEHDTNNKTAEDFLTISDSWIDKTQARFENFKIKKQKQIRKIKSQDNNTNTEKIPEKPKKEDVDNCQLFK